MGRFVLRNVRKAFGDVVIIPALDLDIEDGEFVVFVGPSGCGKSTLLRLIAGLEDVSAGEIRIDGVDVANEPPAKRGLSMVFQSYALYPHMSVRGNIAFALKMAGQPKDVIARKVEKAAATLNLTSYLDRKPRQLSGGQRQRVAIGRAIVREPKAFLFDEPLSNLDAALRVQMRLEITQLHQALKTTMIYVTHDQVEAMTMADRIVVLRDGVTEQIGTPIELYARPRNRFVAGFLGAPQMNMLAGVIRSAGPAGLRAEVDRGRGMVAASVAAGAPGPGEKCTIGIRPEHLLPSEHGDLRAIVEATEMVGADTLVYAKLQSGERVIASIRGIHPIEEGSPLAFAVDQRFVHVFGADDLALAPLRPWRDDYVSRFPTARSEREELGVRVG